MKFGKCKHGNDVFKKLCDQCFEEGVMKNVCVHGNNLMHVNCEKCFLENKMKMYILVLDWVPDHMVPVICAHASLSAYLNLKDQYVGEFEEWLGTSFQKVVCRVSQDEFELAMKKQDGYWIINESSLSRVVALTFVPRKENHKCFKFFKMWKPL